MGKTVRCAHSLNHKYSVSPQGKATSTRVSSTFSKTINHMSTIEEKLWYPTRKNFPEVHHTRRKSNASLHLAWRKKKYTPQYFTCLGKSWVDHHDNNFALFFYTWALFSQKSLDLKYFSPCNNIADIARFWKASIGMHANRLLLIPVAADDAPPV